MFPDLTRDDVFRLETRRLWLRWPRLADAQAVVRLAGEKAVADMTARIPHPYSPEQAERFIFQARRSNANGEGLQLAITPKGKPNSLIGMVGITADPDTGKPNLGYWLGIPSWGQGYATEATNLLFGSIVGVSDRQVLELGIVAEITACARVINPASRRVLEKCGFAYQGAGLSELPARCGLYPVDHFRLDRRTWESLKAWGHTGFIPEPACVEVEMERSVPLAS